MLGERITSSAQWRSPSRQATNDEHATDPLDRHSDQHAGSLNPGTDNRSNTRALRRIKAVESDRSSTSASRLGC